MASAPAPPLDDERSLLDWLAQRLEDPGYLGDDAARVRLGDRDFALTVDSQIEGVHFVAGLDPRVVARRLLAVNLSDLAAVGATPRFGLLALNAPRGFDHRVFLDTLASALAAADVTLVGGDLASTDRLTASLTLLGELDAEAGWPGRGNARPGDTLWVGGSLGESAIGRLLLGAGAAWDLDRDPPWVLPSDLPAELSDPAVGALRRHLFPEAQLALGRWLAHHPRAAAIDLSDGLARDLHRLLGASEAGAEIDAERLPAAPGNRELARWLDRDLLELQVAGGEDYVLLFALTPGEDPPAGCHRIGRIVEGTGARLRVAGEWREMAAEGWDHLSRGSRATGREPDSG